MSEVNFDKWIDGSKTKKTIMEEFLQKIIDKYEDEKIKQELINLKEQTEINMSGTGQIYSIIWDEIYSVIEKKKGGKGNRKGKKFSTQSEDDVCTWEVNEGTQNDQGCKDIHESGKSTGDGWCKYNGKCNEILPDMYKNKKSTFSHTTDRNIWRSSFPNVIKNCLVTNGNSNDGELAQEIINILNKYKTHKYTESESEQEKTLDLFTATGSDKNLKMYLMEALKDNSESTYCQLLPETFKRTEECHIALTADPVFSIKRNSTRDSAIQLAVKGIYTTFLFSGAMFMLSVLACASWVNSFKIKLALDGKTEGDTPKNDDDKKKNLECVNDKKFPYNIESDPTDCNTLENYLKFPNINIFERILYKTIKYPDKLILSKHAYGDMYISKKKKDENDSQKDIEKPNLDKLYIRERVIPTIKKNIKKYNDKVLYHYYKENIYEGDNSFIEELANLDNNKFEKPKETYADILKEGLDGVWPGVPDGETNDPYDFEIARLIQEYNQKEEEKKEKAKDKSKSKLSLANNPALAKNAFDAMKQSGGGDDDEEEEDPELNKLKKKIKDLSNYRKKLKKDVSLGFIDKHGAIPSNGSKLVGITGLTFYLKPIALLGLFVKYVMISWRMFLNLYHKGLSKMTDHPETKMKVKSFKSFGVNFIASNPGFIASISALGGSISMTIGLFRGLWNWCKIQINTKNYVEPSGWKGTIKLFFVKMCRIIYFLISFVIGVILIAPMGAILTPIFLIMETLSLFKGSKNIRCPKISIWKTMFDTLFSGFTGSFIALMAILVIILIQRKNFYIPCFGDESKGGENAEVTFQNEKNAQGTAAILVFLTAVIAFKKIIG